MKLINGCLKRFRLGMLAKNVCLVIATLAIQSCSTVEAETGRCKAFKDPKYVASVMDTDGKKWELVVTPETASLKCDFEKGKTVTTGTLYFTALIRDGQGFPKPALAVNASFAGSTKTPGGAGFENPVGDVATDSCGIATFTVNWTCPDPKKSVGGLFFVTSGPLSSKAVEVTLEHIVQQDVVAAGTVVK